MAGNAKSKPLPLPQVFLRGILIHNPVLVQVIGIFPVVAAAVSLRTSALLAGVFSLVLIITQFAACAFLKKVPRWIRVAVYLLIGIAVVFPVLYILEKNNAGIRITLGIYLPLMAANPLAALRCEKVAVRSSIKHSFFDSVAASIGYSAVLLTAGFTRELFGSGMIAGKTVSFIHPASGMLMPFGGFIVLGFTAALLRWYVLRRYPKLAKETAFEIVNTSVRVRQIPAPRFSPAEEEPAEAEKESPAPVLAVSDMQSPPDSLPTEDNDGEAAGDIQTSDDVIIQPEDDMEDYHGESGELVIMPEEEVLPDEPVSGESSAEELSPAELPDKEEIPVETPVSEKVPEAVPPDDLQTAKQTVSADDDSQLKSIFPDLYLSEELDSQAIDRRIEDMFNSLEEYEHKTPNEE